MYSNIFIAFSLIIVMVLQVGGYDVAKTNIKNSTGIDGVALHVSSALSAGCTHVQHVYMHVCILIYFTNCIFHYSSAVGAGCTCISFLGMHLCMLIALHYTCPLR